MLARIRKAQEEKEGGFTLIELLVVIIIIGILAAIAIPIFLNQRAKGVDAGVKSDLKQAANEMESFFTDSQAYPTALNIALTTGNALDVGLNAAGTAYCIEGFNPKGSANKNTNAENYVYVSDAGGLQPTNIDACPAGYTTTPFNVT